MFSPVYLEGAEDGKEFSKTSTSAGHKDVEEWSKSRSARDVINAVVKHTRWEFAVDKIWSCSLNEAVEA